MAAGRPQAGEERILLLAPTEKDAKVCRSILAEAGIATAVCDDAGQVCAGIEAGAGAAIVAEEAITSQAFDALVERLRLQPAWSDFPILLLMHSGASSQTSSASFGALGNVILLERPVRVMTLVSAVETALRARRRQYQIRDHLAERQRAAEALRQEAARKDEFLAMLAHELRNPLAPILYAVELLSHAGVDGETMTWATMLMKRQVEHIGRLVDDLMDIARVMQGKIHLRLQPVEVNSAIHHAVEEATPALEAQEQQFSISISPSPIWVMADPNRLSQVIANLLMNAAKYTDRGGRIHLASGQHGQQAVITVEDSGVGIAPEMLEQIFEPFRQVSTSLERARGGLGIGLALVQKLVQMHGGEVEARSAGLGCGSTFEVRLPVIAHSDSDPKQPWRPAPLPARRVLVVDDNQGAAAALAKMLAMFWGHEVAIAHDGLAAIERAKEFQPEVALLDIGLPVLSGYGVAQRLRQMSQFRSTLLVAITGYGQEADRRRSFEAGFDEHLVKPASVTSLEQVFLHPKLRHD